MSDLKDVLEGELAAARDAAAQREKRERYSQFRSGYRASRNRRNGGSFWPTGYEAGSVSFLAPGESSRHYEWANSDVLTALAAQKLEGTATGIESDPRGKGLMAGALVHGLRAAGNELYAGSRYEGFRKNIMNEAIVRMYVLGLGGNRTVRSLIQQRLAAEKSPEVLHTTAKLMEAFDLGGYTGIVADARGRAERLERVSQRKWERGAYVMTLEGNGACTWPMGSDSPHLSFVEQGEQRYERVPWQTASGLAERKRNGQITNVKPAQPGDSGILEASVARALGVAFRPPTQLRLETREAMACEAVAGMYLLEPKARGRALHTLKMYISGEKLADPRVLEALTQGIEKYGLLK